MSLRGVAWNKLFKNVWNIQKENLYFQQNIWKIPEKEFIFDELVPF